MSGRPAHSQLLGHLAGETALTGMSLVLRPTAAQEASLAELLAQQQVPGSPSYHQWLTPEAYGARFGVADADLAVLQGWLQSRGFTVDSVAPSRNRIVFSGTASAVENAFGTSLQRFQQGDQTFFENGSELQIPAALAEVVSGVTGLSSFRLPAPQAVARPLTESVAKPYYTTGGGNHYLVPWDFRQIFGINTLIGAGYTGSGIRIGVLGQSAVDPTQLTYFQQKTGQTVTLPTMVLVPNTGPSIKIAADEGESELDLEYASGSAPGANVQFIYTGCTTTAGTSNCGNNGVFDAMAYAITNNLAPVLTFSYGACENDVIAYANATFEPILKQANAQGQTILVSSGDEGAATCDQGSQAVTVAKGGLTVSYPASSVYVTAVGGTSLAEGTGSYWATTNNSFGGSAVGYIPETAWNDSASYGSIAATGGGASKVFSKPSWQAGPGVPADGHRDVPDVAFPAGVVHDGYLVCTQHAPCQSGSGFGSTGNGTNGGVVGGTSASAPNFAAMLAVIEQANGGSALGNLNPRLYAIAAGNNYSTVFHDITSGNNIVACTVGTPDCTTGSMGYNAGPGYDQVTGLGSLVAPALQAALAVNTATPPPTPTPLTPTVTLSASTTAPVVGASVTFTASVSGSGASPTGTVSFSVDGASVGSAVALANGSASYVYSSGFTAAGAHTVTAAYSGDTAYASGSANLNITASNPPSVVTPGISLAVTPSTLTVASGSSGAATVRVTSTGGFAGAVMLTTKVLSSSGAAFAGCVPTVTATPAANATVTVGMTVYTSSSNCTKASVMQPGPMPQPGRGLPAAAFVIATAGLLGFWRRRMQPALLLVVLLVGLGAVVGCGSGGSAAPATSTPAPTTASSAGTYVLQVTGVDSAQTVSATTTFSLAVQ